MAPKPRERARSDAGRAANVTRRQAFWWTLTAGYIGITYASLGAMPGYWYALNDLLSGNGILFQYCLYAAVGAVVLGAVYRRGFLRSVESVAVTGVVIAVFAVMFYLEKNPGEKIHMFQYGVLGWLVYKALTLHFHKTSIRLYATGALICLVAGALDEVIQHMLPNRYFTLHDIVINGLSGVIVLLYIYYYQLHKEGVGERASRSRT